jgi:hypothetical protein
MLTYRDVNKFEHNILEKYTFSALTNISGIFYFSS